MSDAVIDPAKVEQDILSGAFHQWLGLSVEAVDDTSITLKARWRPEWTNDSGNGVTHGGIIASLLDLAADWALVGTAGTAVPTIDFSVQYLRAAGQGDLTVIGRLVKPGRSVSFAQAELYSADGKLVATGRGSYVASAAAGIIAGRQAGGSEA